MKGGYKYILIILLFSSLLVGGLIWQLDRYPSIYRIDTQESVSGLLIGAPVEYKGVNVGTVKSINIKNAQTIEIFLSIKKDTPLTKGTMAVLTTRGLTSKGFTGFVYITLEDKGTDSTPLTSTNNQPYPLIPLSQPKSLSLDTTLLNMNENLQTAIQLFQTVFDKENVTLLKNLLQNLKDISQTLATNNKKLHSLLVNAEKASHHFDPFLKGSMRTLTILETQLLPQTYQALSSLNETSQSLSILLTLFKNDPSVLIRGTTAPTPGPGE
jgi:phospholipid/cholesterol/gamma-HCH transport system substrate-binding protein